MIDEPGLYDIPSDEYHADPAKVPSLTSSTAKTLVSKSPLHVSASHPRLATKKKDDGKDTFDLGTAAHTLLLGDGRDFEIVKSQTWRGKFGGLTAEEFKSDARSRGLIPILERQYLETVKMVQRCRDQISRSECPEAFTSGRGEQTLVWQENGVWCRALLDWHPDDVHDNAVWYDYKTTDGSAHPDDWSINIGKGMRADIQAALYLRGIRAVFGVRNPSFRFVVQERGEPYAMSIIEPTPEAIAEADKDVDRALELWGQCLDKDVWPGYPNRVVYVDTHRWAAEQRAVRLVVDPIDSNMVDRMRGLIEQET